MSAIRVLTGLLPVRRFGADDRALAAIEFAMILPVMLVIYLGSVEVAQLIGIDRKTALVTRTTADLVSRLSNCKTSTVPTEITGVFKAADAVIAPYSPSSLSVVVSCVAIDKNGVATLKWSQANRGTPRTSANSVVPPSGIGDGLSTTYWVLGEASYAYTPVIGYVLSGTYNVSEQVFMNSRL